MECLLKHKNVYPRQIEDYRHYKTTRKEVEAVGYKVLVAGDSISI